MKEPLNIMNLTQPTALAPVKREAPRKADERDERSESRDFEAVLRETTVREEKKSRKTEAEDKPSDRNGLAAEDEKALNGEEGSSRSASLSPNPSEKGQERTSPKDSKQDVGDPEEESDQKFGSEVSFLSPEIPIEQPVAKAPAKLANAVTLNEIPVEPGKPQVAVLLDQNRVAPEAAPKAVPVVEVVNLLEPKELQEVIPSLRAAELTSLNAGKTVLPEGPDSRPAQDNPFEDLQHFLDGERKPLFDASSEKGDFFQKIVLEGQLTEKLVRPQTEPKQNAAVLPGEVANPADLNASQAGDVTSQLLRAEGLDKTHAPRAAEPHSRVVYGSLEDQVLRQIRFHLSPEKSSVDIRLFPPELGAIRIQFELEGNQMRARVHASESVTASMLERHIPELRSAMQESGIHVKEMEIVSDGGPALDFSEPRESREGHGNNTQSEELEDGSMEEEERVESHTMLPSLGHDRLDLLV